jgi:hypothetical protein
VQLSAVVVNRVLPELFGQRRKRSSSSCASPEAEAVLLGRAGRAVPPRCSRRPGWPSPCGAPAPDPPAAAPGRARPDRLPVLYLPDLFTRTHGLRTTRQVAQSLGEELGTDGDPLRAHRGDRAEGAPGPTGGAIRRPAATGRWTGSRHQGDRHGLRPRRGGQDHHRGRRSVPWPRSEHGSKVLVLTVDPAQTPGRRPGPRRHRQHRAPGPRRGVQAPPGSSLGASCGRPCWTPRSRGTPSSAAMRPTWQTRDEILANPLYQNISGRFVQSARLHRHGAALRDPLRERLRPDRGGHPADQERPRLPRRAAAHGRLLLFAAAALADRALPVAAGQRGHQTLLLDRRPDPRHRVPRRHLRILHPVPVDVRRLRRAFRRGGATALGPPHHVHRGVDPRGGAPPRRRSSSPSS